MRDAEAGDPGAQRPGPASDRGGGRRARLRELGVGIALAVTVATLFLGVAELLARLTEPPAPPLPEAYITDWQAWDGDFYTVKSTAAGWPPWEDYNTEGLRDREHPIEKRPGSWRVACLGDSVTLGWGIRPQQAWPQMLEDLAAASGRDLDVMNVALGGWSTRQELIAYRRIVRRYRPDQVLLGICLNDVPEMQNNLSRPSKLVAALHLRSALVRRVVNAREREIGAVEELFTAPEAAKVRRAYELMFADLRRLRDEVREDGSSLAILVFPFRFQVLPGAPPPLAQGTIAAFCRREGIPVLDVLPAVSRLGPAAFRDYDHLSADGARLVAAQVLASPLLAGPEAGAGAGEVREPHGAVAGAVAAGSADWQGLVEALRDPSESRRAAAAHGLATLGEAAAPAVPALVVALDDPKRTVRAAAAWALGDVGPVAVAAVPSLRRLLDDADPFVRAGAVFGLGEVGAAARKAVPGIVPLLEDPDERVRWRASDALVKIGLAADSVDALARLVRKAQSPGRGFAAEALGHLGGEARGAVPDLIAAVSDQRADVRWRAVWALGRIGPAAGDAVLALRMSLADPDVRWRAAQALGEIGPGAASAVPELITLLHDPSSNVRWRAAEALGAIRSPHAASALATAVDDEAENVRLAAVVALSSVGAGEALAESAYIRALGDRDPRVRLQAVRGLGRLGPLSGRARAALRTAGKDPDLGVRTHAASVLRRHVG